MTGYIVQTVVLAIVASAIFHHRLRGAHLYSMIWMIGVIAIRGRYGNLAETLFYSNDQRHHAVVTNALVELGINSDWGYMLRSGRIAYTLPAALLQWIGFETVLALKFVSLMSFLLAATVAVRYMLQLGIDERLLYRYLTVFGPAGVFFSLLALRETMMLMLVTLFFVDSRWTVRAGTLVAAVTLRPHLAAALVVGSLFAPLAMFIARKMYYVAIILTLLIPAMIGNAGYSIGIWLIDGVQLELTRTTLSSDAIFRILTNLVGLQFLAADATTTELNFADLMLARIPFLETILIPLLFTATLLFAPRLTELRWRIFGSFSFYLGLVTVTDFNSFRQNIPFMAVFGLLAVTEGIAHTDSNHTTLVATRHETSG